MKKRTKKIVSLLLCLTFALSLLSYSTYAEVSIRTVGNTKAAEGSHVLDYVDPISFAANRHIARVPAEEYLNTYVFENEDGSHTHYVLKENVKYRTASGEIREKDLTLVEKNARYSVKENEFDLSFSQEATLRYQNYTFTLTPSVTAKPEKGEKSVLLKQNDVTAAFIPSLTGFTYNVKLEEETKLPSYTLHTNGLTLKQENGFLFFQDGRSTVFQLSVPVAYCENGNFAPCQLTIQDLGSGAYEIQPEFSSLLFEDEVEYPILLNSIMAVTSTTITASGTSGIDDAPVYSGMNTSNFGNYIYLTIGYLNNTYKIGRVFAKFPGIYNNSYFQNYTVTDMKYYLYDASGISAQSITAKAITGSWQENTIIWNDISNFAYSSSLYNTQNMSSGGWTTFNLTSFINRWKTSSYAAQSGLNLTNANESSSSYRKTPYSVESTTNPSYATFTVTI